MKKNLLLLLLLLVTTVAQDAFSQGRKITGRVTGAGDGESLPGVTVAIKGTPIGTITDINGSYQLTVPSAAKELTFSYLGLKTKTVEISGDVINVSMESDALNIDEVVVTALGVRKEKKALGYSQQQVSGDQLTGNGNTNVLNSLTGKVAGMQITSSSGAPGSSSYIKLRGATTFSLNNQPLIVVDGIPIDNTQNFSGNPDDGRNNLLSSVANSNRGIDIDPNEIESINVLKGPAASALYGINAASGVLVITTKKGSSGTKGKPINVTYSSTLTFETPNKLPELQSKYSQGFNGLYQAPSVPAAASWGALIDTLRYDGATTNPYDKNGNIVGASNPLAKGNVNVYDNQEQFFRTGTTWDNSIALSGGSSETNYRLAASKTSSDGIVPLSNFERNSIKIAGDTKLSSMFTTGASINYINTGGRRVQQGSNVSGLMLGLLRTPRTFDNSNGASDPEDESAYLLANGNQRNYRGGGGYDNPYWTINKNPFKDDVNRIIGVTNINFTPASWLNVMYRIGTDVYTDRRKQIFAIGSRNKPAGQIFEDQRFFRSINSDLIATINRKLTDDLGMEVILGNNIYGVTSQQLYTQGDGFAFKGFEHISNASAVISRETLTRKRTFAYYGDVKFDYKNFLYLELTGRQETSSALPLENNTFFNPSANLGLVFTELLGMQDNSILPYGKIRASYAKAGKDAPAYSTSTYYNSSAIQDGFTNGISFPFNGVSGFSRSDVLGNPKLKVETTTSTEFGAELKFFRNRANLDVTYFSSKSTDLILNVPIAASTGYLQSFLNVGEMSSQGVEVILNLTPIKTKDFSWDISFNYSRIRNNVDKLADGIENVNLGGFEGSDIRAVTGNPYGIIFGGKFLRDANGKMVIDDDPTSPGYGYPIADPKNGVLGNPNPNWLGGIRNTFGYKGFALSGLIDIKNGGQIWNGTEGALTFFGMSKITETRGENKVFEGVKQSDGTANNISVPLDQAWYRGNGGGFGSVAEGFIQDAGFIRLREVSLSYKLSPKILKGTFINSVDLSIIGRNLLLITDYAGVDPETSLTGANDAQGMDYFNMPNTKSIGFGLRVTL